ncbi:MAG: UbiD family decarboxylase [Candidatus Altiarchaeota archaeon]|nr:UbiD family decarboxylase [Candidatus Altiarchaeota archaeon]
MSSLRDFLDELKKDGELESIEKEADPHLEIARIIRGNDKKTILFNKVKGSNYRVVSGVCGSRKNYVKAFGLKGEEELLKHISKAIDNPKQPDKTNNAPCKEVVEKEADLSKIPVLTHNSRELGPYITSGVYIAKDPEYGTNASFHRTAVIGKNRLVARICRRDLYKFMERAGGEMEMAICIGLHPAVLLAAAVSMPTGTSELDIANSLTPYKVTRCETKDIHVPADAEIVLEGRITKERTNEGPFIDITGTFDHARKEPVIEIDCITHRKDPIYHALVSSLSEHKLLMGMPREPVIYKEVNKVAGCLDVALTEGGCCWLDGVVKIRKENEDDGKKAIEAAFRGHASMKHVVVVDEDIDIHDTNEVEWAIATRSQAGKNWIMKQEKGSSLDPSAEVDRTTWKAGIDATIPWGRVKERFLKGEMGK